MVDLPDPHIQACVVFAAQRYATPPALLYSILKKEGGRVGQAVRNKNGSFDYGPVQVNSSWLPKLADYGITTAMLKDSACVNIVTGAWILRKNYDEKQDWTKAIIAYNVGYRQTPKRLAIGTRYAYDVISYWHQFHRVLYGATR